MIGYLEGTVLAAEGATLTILCHGVGYLVQSSVSAPEQSSVSLWIYPHWHADHGVQLFGFATQAARKLFTLIISSPGIGPKIALLLLKELELGVIIQAITGSNPKLLSTVSGVGPKKAEAIVMHLKDKLTDHMDEFAAHTSTYTMQLADLAQALQVLGYDKQEVGKAVHYISTTGVPQEPFDSLMRRALAQVAKRA